MKIIPLTPDHYQEFIEFNKQIYPGRKNIENRFKLQVLENPLLTEKSHPPVLLMCNKENQIVGFQGGTPLQYCWQGETIDCLAGIGGIIQEEYQKKGRGAFLMHKWLKTHSSFFTIGISQLMQQILLSLGMQKIGEAHTYLWIRKFSSPLKMAWSWLTKDKYQSERGSDVSCFPEKVSFQNNQFIKVNSQKQIRISDYSPWKKEVLEFSRSPEFLDWRFMGKETHALYQLDPATYFVLKKVDWLGMNLLAILDYKYSDKNKFKLILRLAKLMAKKMDCDGVITVSSHHFFDAQLKDNSFFKIGKPFPIMTNVAIDVSKERIEKRDLILVKMVDPDLEFAHRAFS
tara:strand:- start:3341 stop:4372 length:1032 start_codon:yes stop_codon:yes gene_type:complete